MRRRLLRCTPPLALVVAALLSWAVASATGASRPADPARPSAETLQLGPLVAAHGFKLYVTDQGCGSASNALSLSFVRTGGGGSLSHVYTGASATCTVDAATGTARIAAGVRGALVLGLTVTPTGAKPGGTQIPITCTAGLRDGVAGPITARLTGRIAVTIHPDVLGAVTADSGPAMIWPGGTSPCATRTAAGTRELTAAVGPALIDGLAPARGADTLSIQDSWGDTMADGLTGTLEIQSGGGRGYRPVGQTADAQITGPSSLTTGSLSFSPLAACPGATAVNGTLAGTLTIDDPLLGPLAINGADADSAYSGMGSAQPGGCNGPGSRAVSPDVISSCEVNSDNCSIAAGANTVAFSDETDPGTQSISSEELDFGDGSAPVPITNFGTVIHTYAAPGTYIATLTVTTAAGATASSTATSYIAP